MKKCFCILFIISTFFPCHANATYYLNFFNVRNYTYENGKQLNRLAFGVVDINSQYPSTDVLGSVVLTDPNGKNMDITLPVRFIGYLAEEGYYDADNGQWIYPPFYSVSEYATEFKDQLITGSYRLTFTDKNGEVSKQNFTFNKIVDLPIIPSGSYRYYRDQDGNFIWQWQAPVVDPNIQTSVRAWIDAYDEQNKFVGEIYVRVPTHLGELFVPKKTFDQILSMGKTFKLGTHVRTNDNNNRAFSTSVKMRDLALTGCTATLNGDFSLQIPYVSYVNPVLGTISLWTELVYEYNPTYPTLLLFRFANYGIIDNPFFSCEGSTLSDDFKIHIPDLLFSDGITHLWVDLEYSAAHSTDENAYFLFTDYGVVSN